MGRERAAHHLVHLDVLGRYAGRYLREREQGFGAETEVLKMAELGELSPAPFLAHAAGVVEHERGHPGVLLPADVLVVRGRHEHEFEEVVEYLVVLDEGVIRGYVGHGGPHFHFLREVVQDGSVRRRRVRLVALATLDLGKGDHSDVEHVYLQDVREEGGLVAKDATVATALRQYLLHENAVQPLAEVIVVMVRLDVRRLISHYLKK